MTNEIIPNGGPRDSFDSSPNPEMRGNSLIFTKAGDWARRDDGLIPETLLALGITRCAIMWNGVGKPPTIDSEAQTAEAVDALNAGAPESDWEIGLDGKPRAPWALQIGLHMVDPASGGLFTFPSTTVGGRIAAEILVGDIKR